MDRAHDTRPERLRNDECDRDWILDRDVECASPEDLRAMSQAAWEVQAKGIKARSPFYARKFDGIDLDTINLDNLAELPFTTKNDLKESQAANPPFGDYLGVEPDQVKRIYQTSGTTGKPCVIALTANDIRHSWGAVQARAYYASGVHEHNSVLSTFGAGPFVAGSTHRVLENLGARTVPVGPGDTERVLNALQAGLVDTIQGTPTFAQYLANVVRDAGLDGRSLGLRHILSGGEPGGGIPAVRDFIEESFDAEVTEIYGLGDITPSLLGECPVGGGLHWCGQGIVWPELIDTTTQEPLPIEPGVIGEPVYTALTREAMPLIRYRSGDIFEIQEGQCPCGRTSWRARCVGRVDDMFIVRGVNAYPSAIQAIVADFRPEVTGRIRVVLPEEGFSVAPPVPVEVEVADDATPSPELAKRIDDTLRSKLIFRTAVEFVPVSKFGDAAYKTRQTIRRPAAD